MDIQNLKESFLSKAISASCLCLLLFFCHAQGQSLKVMTYNDNPKLIGIWEKVYEVHKDCWIDSLNDLSTYEVQIDMFDGDTIVYIKNAIFLRYSTLNPTHQFDYKGIRFVVRFMPKFDEADPSMLEYFFNVTNEQDDWYFKTNNYNGGLPPQNDPNWRDVTSVIIEAKLNGASSVDLATLVDCMPISKTSLPKE